MIRKAVKTDIDTLKEMGADFYAYSDLPRFGLNFKPDELDRILFSRPTEKVRVICLVNETSDKTINAFIVGYVHPWMLDTSQVILTVLWWWSKDRPSIAGMSLFYKLINEAYRHNEITHVFVSSGRQENAKDLGKILKRLDFVPCETYFVKEVKHGC